MSNNTFNNVINGIQISLNGNTANAFINSVNSANVYGIIANISSNKINIICSNPGPFYLNESDKTNTPLANAGIVTGKYNSSTVITGSINNPTFNNSSYFNIGINWNSILNSFPKSQRKLFKEIYIAKQERQKVGSNSYRKLNIYTGSVSPTSCHPWSPLPDIFFNSLIGAIDGSNNIFYLQYATTNTQSLIIFYNGETLTQGLDYNISNNSVIIFTFAPEPTAILLCYYINNPTSEYTITSPTGLLNGINTIYSLPSIPHPAISLKLFYNGMLLIQNTDYTIVNSSITLIFAPSSTDLLLASYRSSSLNYNYADAIVPNGTLDGINTIFTLPNIPNPSNDLQLFYNGEMCKNGIDYNINNNIITYTFSPMSNSINLAYYIY